jgi:RNA polymerase sigma-70 factor (ECF subfamily)
LLFNEGYHGANPESAVRADLCSEAMRLTAIILEHPAGQTPATHALAALMCLNAARLPARVDAAGNLSPLFNQDRSKWNQELVSEGLRFLELSAAGSNLSEYHLEAAIASVHATAARAEDTDWRRIASLYDALMTINSSPVIALNRAIAISQIEGPDRGLQEIRAIGDPDRLTSYPFYSAALGELELRRGRYDCARAHFQKALTLARSDMERRFLIQRIAASEKGEPG